MFDRIVMNIVDVLAVVRFVPNHVFPIPLLPNGPLRVTGGFGAAPLSYPGLNQPPTRRIVGIAPR